MKTKYTVMFWIIYSHFIWNTNLLINIANEDHIFMSRELIVKMIYHE